METRLQGSDGTSYAVPPSGTVTLWFSDIEGSTQRWEMYPAAMSRALHEHDELMRTAVIAQGGLVFKTVGDAICAVFHRPTEAVAAALAAQRAIAAGDWSAIHGLRVRMAIHAGETDERGGDYFGPTVNRVARLLSTAHGGQIVVSGVVAQLLQDEPLSDCSLRDLGVHRLKDLGRGEHVYQVVAPGLAGDFPPLHSLEAVSNNLPLQPTSFVGRTQEIAAIKESLARARLVTLVGAGGIGKTRTALQVGADVLELFSDGVWFADLAPIADPESVAATVAAIFHLDDVGGETAADRLHTALRNKCALIILDNCEHVIAAAAGLVDAILLGCASVKVLATSREALAVAGERQYRLPSLGLPSGDVKVLTATAAGDSPAVQLFIDSARRVTQDFALTDANAPVVARIARSLDGIPFAIELAAVRIASVGLQELAQRLDQQLRILTGGSRTALPRQQTLRALIDWSYDLLSEPERMLLRHCSIFRGGWTLDAAEDVCGSQPGECDVLASTAGLVEKSLVVAEPIGAQQRYRLLEPTRQYASERLREAREEYCVAARHCAYFARLSAGHYAEYRRSSPDRWIEDARSELENYRAAIQWGLTLRHDIEAGATIVGSLCPLWLNSLRGEGRAFALGAREALSEHTQARTRGIVLQAIAFLDGESGRNVEAAREAVAVLADNKDSVYAEAMHSWAMSLVHAGRYAEACRIFDEVLAAAHVLQLPQLVVAALIGIGNCAMQQGDSKRARQMFEDCIAVISAQSDRRQLPTALHNLAELFFSEGDCAAAIRSSQDAIAIDREFGRERSLMFGLVNLAAYLLAARDVDGARLCGREALEIAVRCHQPIQAAWAIQHLAQTAALAGRLEAALTLLAYVDGVCAREGTLRSPTEQVGYDLTVRLLQERLTPDRAARLADPQFIYSVDEKAAIGLALSV